MTILSTMGNSQTLFTVSSISAEECIVILDGAIEEQRKACAPLNSFGVHLGNCGLPVGNRDGLAEQCWGKDF